MRHSPPPFFLANYKKIVSYPSSLENLKYTNPCNQLKTYGFQPPFYLSCVSYQSANWNVNFLFYVSASAEKCNVINGIQK
jgi:hypothetical protein